MESPLVSCICICHNQKSYLSETLDSVLHQTYKNTELIIIDDCSTDGSQEIIRKFAEDHPVTKFRLLENISGICKAFNAGFQLSGGDYIIDLAADDILLPGRVEEGIKTFSLSDDSYGINFTDAAYIDEEGRFLRYHYPRNKSGKRIGLVPEGSIYNELLSRYFICTPTMMAKRKVIEFIGGYDETLAYEDFDFWIRTSKKFRYCYTDQVLVNKRITPNSLSSKQYSKDSLSLKSTLEVCKKAEKINENKEDRKSLLKRIRYEFRMAVRSGNFTIADEFIEMMKRNGMGIHEIMAYGAFLKIISVF
jgi:glycosyltransferase involved in cell wall biosynthesis